jgi:hypothetical protein
MVNMLKASNVSTLKRLLFFVSAYLHVSTYGSAP